MFAIVAYAKPAKQFMDWVTVALQKGLEYFGHLGSEHMRCRWTYQFYHFSQMILLFFTARLLLQKFQMGCKRVVYSKDQVRVEVLHLCCFSILFYFMWWFCSILAQIHCQHMPWLFSDGLDVVGSENHTLREVVHMKVWPL